MALDSFIMPWLNIFLTLLNYKSIDEDGKKDVFHFINILYWLGQDLISFLISDRPELLIPATKPKYPC